MNWTGVVIIMSQTPHVNQGSCGIGAQVIIVAPAARPRKNAALRMARNTTPARAMETLFLILLSSSSGASNVRTHPVLQK